MQTLEQLGFTEKPDQEDVIELLFQSLELTNVFDKKKTNKKWQKNDVTGNQACSFEVLS